MMPVRDPYAQNPAAVREILQNLPLWVETSPLAD